MKKLATILVFVFSFTLSTQAQKERDHKRPKLTTAQQTDLAVKKMTLALDLSEKQQNEIRPLIATKTAERKAFMEKRKEAKKNKKRPTADEIYAMQSKRLDNQIAMNNKMKTILTEKQFEKFLKIQEKRTAKGKKWLKKKAPMRERGKERMEE